MYMPVSHVVLAHVDLINALFIIHYSLFIKAHWVPHRSEPTVDHRVDIALRNFGVAPTFNNFKTKLPTSLNVALTYPYKQWMFYEQHNLMKKNITSGFGVSYKYEVKDQGIIFGKAGYFVDTMHDLTYPTFGLDLKYDRYFIGMSYIYGDQTLPVSNTFRLTINLEI